MRQFTEEQVHVASTLLYFLHITQHCLKCPCLCFFLFIAHPPQPECKLQEGRCCVSYSHLYSQHLSSPQSARPQRVQNKYLLNERGGAGAGGGEPLRPLQKHFSSVMSISSLYSSSPYPPASIGFLPLQGKG